MGNSWWSDVCCACSNMWPSHVWVCLCYTCMQSACAVCVFCVCVSANVACLRVQGCTFPCCVIKSGHFSMGSLVAPEVLPSETVSGSASFIRPDGWPHDKHCTHLHHQLWMCVCVYFPVLATYWVPNWEHEVRIFWPVLTTSKGCLSVNTLF